MKTLSFRKDDPNLSLRLLAHNVQVSDVSRMLNFISQNVGETLTVLAPPCFGETEWTKVVVE